MRGLPHDRTRESRKTWTARGMTLVEVMVALSILSVAAVIVLQALATIYRALDVAEDRSAVCGFAGSKMAELILRPLEKNELSFSDGGSFSAGPQRFEWEGQGRPLAFNPALGSVELKIRWHKGRGSYESDFSTLVSLPLEKKEPKMGETP